MFSHNNEEKKLDWMYKGPGGAVDREEYLLGRSIDKSLEQLNAAEKQGSASANPPKNHVEHECIPPSIRDFKKMQYGEQVDLAQKLQEDPLVAIKKREEETRQKLLQNPVQLKKLQKVLKLKSKKKKKKNKKKHRKQSASDSNSSEELDSKLAEKYENMKNQITNTSDLEDEDLDKLVIKKFMLFKHLLTKADLDEILTMDRNFNSSDEENNKKANRKYDSSPENDDKFRRKGKQFNRKKSRSRSPLMKPDKNRDRYPRKNREESNKNRYSRNKRDTSSDSDSDLNEKHLYSRRKFKENVQRQKEDKNRKQSKLDNYKKSNSDNKKDKHHKDKDTKSSKRKNLKSKHSSSESESEDTDDTRKQKKRKKNKKESKHKQTESSSDSESNDTSDKKYKNSKNDHKGSKSLKKKKQKPKDSDSDSDSDDSKDKKITNRYENKYDSDEEKLRAKRNFGLVKADGTKIPLSKRNSKHDTRDKKEHKKESETSTQKVNDKYKRKRLTEEEIEQRRKEMMQNAEWRDKERSRNVKKYREEDMKDSKIDDYKPEFIQKELLKSANNSTVESRIKSNINNIQRSGKDMSTHFSRRH